MERIPRDQWDEEGCFVYRALAELTVSTDRTVTNARADGYSFAAGQLVSVDFIRPTRYQESKNGPFLRLTDGKGWLYERKYGTKVMERLPVKKGLWCFYVDNCNVGMALREHPFDASPHVRSQVAYKPMQKIYCDREIEDTKLGVKSYRVQGTTGWVFDTRITGETRSRMMLPESMVQTGLFAYMIILNGRLGVSIEPNVSEDKRVSSGWTIGKNEIVCCNAIRETSEYFPSIFEDERETGPFLRLTDGTGWIFAYKPGTGIVARQHKIEDGSWICYTAKDIPLRRHPIDRDDMKTADVFPMGTSFECDKKIVSDYDGTTFYRVVGTDGWILKSQHVSLSHGTKTQNIQNPWDLQYIRGLAAAFDLEEIVHNKESRVISFRSFDDERVNVYYTTRTIGTVIDLSDFESKTQIFQRNCTDRNLKEIFRAPRSMVGKGYAKRKRSKGKDGYATEQSNTTTLDAEEDSRQSLLECDMKLDRLLKERLSILKSIRHYDIARTEEATAHAKKVEAHEKALREAAERRKKAAEESLRRQEAERQRQEAERQRQEEEERRRRRALTCDECYCTFVNHHALMQHCRDAHALQCYYCYKIFKSEHALSQHREDTGHY